MQGELVPGGQSAEGPLSTSGVTAAHVTERHPADGALGAVLKNIGDGNSGDGWSKLIASESRPRGAPIDSQLARCNIYYSEMLM